MAETNGAMNLKAIVTEMRELGVMHLKTPEYEIDLGPAPGVAPPKKKDTEVDGIERDKRQWEAYWRKATRSSGAPLPPYPTKRVTT